jgi:DNA-binding NtrC family response regulator
MEDLMSSTPTLIWKPWRPTADGRFLPAMEIPEQGTSLEGIERELIELALKQAGGNQTQAARLLGITRDTLRYRIKKFELAKEVQPKNEAAELDREHPPSNAGSLKV